jgi:hypothetical protein
MGKIYSPPAEIKVPEFNWEDIPAYEAACNKFVEDLKVFCINRNNAEHVGEVIQFPVADGYAQYMVASLSPVELIHLPLWDAWGFQYASRLTKKDIIEKINQKKALKKLFPPRG